MEHQESPARRALALLRAGVRAVVITALLLLVPNSPQSVSDSAREAGEDLKRVMSRHDCRPTGFSAHPEASAALVRSPDGDLEVVDRQEGRAVYAGREPGTLVAVCGVQQAG